jgi:3-dehydroquinate synthase
MSFNKLSNQVPSLFWGENGYMLLSELIEKKSYSMIFVLVDSNTNEHCLWPFMSQFNTALQIEIIELDPGESEKNIETCHELWHVLMEHGGDRKSAILNLGGGVITDMGGFVASLFKRGIDFIHVPTTLLGMVDAAHGGKTAVDLGTYKNQVGLFSWPKAILIDPIFLETLPAREMRCGLAEMFKHGLIHSKSHWDSLKDTAEKDWSHLEALIQDSIAIKNDIVAQDPWEQNERKWLNFGHTVGHAIESLFLEKTPDNPILHGEAVAAGILIESYLSMELSTLSRAQYFEIDYIIKRFFDPLPISKSDLPKLLSFILTDKKNTAGQIGCTLLQDIGHATFKNDISIEQFESAIIHYIN